MACSDTNHAAYVKGDALWKQGRLATQGAKAFVVLIAFLAALIASLVIGMAVAKHSLLTNRVPAAEFKR